MKYVILIHSSPRPWGHPTSEYLPEYQDLPREQRDRLNAEFEKMLTELQENGELPVMLGSRDFYWLRVEPA